MGSDGKAKPVERNVVMTAGCTECHSNAHYTLWEKNGQTWYSCSNKIGSQYCKGRPPDDAQRVDGKNPTAPEEGIAAPTAAPSRAPSGGSSDILDKIADNFAELSTLFAELAHQRRAS